jgi:hypothetical protein
MLCSPSIWTRTINTLQHQTISRMSSAIYHSKHRKYNGKAKKDKKTNNDLENTTQKTKFPATGTPPQ